MTAPTCTDCGKPVLSAGFRISSNDPHRVVVCHSCRSARGGRSYAKRAEAHRATRLIDVALSARLGETKR